MNKMTRRIIGIICAAVCAICAVFAVRAFSGGKTSPNAAKHGVVYIENVVYDAQGNMAGGSGTGWMIGKKGEDPQYVVTNAHVVAYYYAYSKGLVDLAGGNLSVFFSAAENDYVLPQIVYYSEPSEKDIAILKIPSPTDKRAPLEIADSGKVTPGDEVYAIGYPGVSLQSQDYIRYDEDDATLTKGIVSKERTSTITDTQMFEIDAVINHGNSGGPLVDKNGHVIGINESISQETVAGVDEYGNLKETYISNDLGYAIVSNDLVKILDAEKIPYASAGAGGAQRFIFLIAAIAALAAALFFLFGKDKKVAAAAGSPAQAPAGQGAYGAPTAASGGAIRGAARPAGGARAPVLRGVTGQYAGQSFSLAGGPLTIGRNGQLCNVVFDKDAPGVSGNHCTVRYDGAADAFLLTDNGSSYGTFLGNDRKLAANVPEKLHEGDGFYLANHGNRFLVTKE